MLTTIRHLEMNPSFLRAFVLGTSALIVFPHYLAVANLDPSKLTYTYESYTFIAPLYYGLMNVVSLYLALAFALSRRQRYLLIGVLSPLLVTSLAYFMGTYPYTNVEWLWYAVRLFVMHFLNWNVVVFSLDKFV